MRNEGLKLLNFVRGIAWNSNNFKQEKRYFCLFLKSILLRFFRKVYTNLICVQKREKQWNQMIYICIYMYCLCKIFQLPFLCILIYPERVLASFWNNICNCVRERQIFCGSCNSRTNVDNWRNLCMLFYPNIWGYQPSFGGNTSERDASI